MTTCRERGPQRQGGWICVSVRVERDRIASLTSSLNWCTRTGTIVAPLNRAVLVVHRQPRRYSRSCKCYFERSCGSTRILPPLPALFIACPPITLAEAEPGAGDGVADCREAPTLRI